MNKNTPERITWMCMNQRVKSKGYYSERGIKVCKRWNKFENFLADMGRKPSPNYQLDRINNDGDYEPSNCRWATPKENSNNRRSNTFVEFGGERLTLSQWGDRIGGNRHTVSDRLKKGWPIQMAVTVPVGWTMVDLWKSFTGYQNKTQK
jgi:hypothetical protein